MEDLHNTIKHAMTKQHEMPFSVYSSAHEQKLLNVPVTKPLLIFVLSGEKILGLTNELTCPAGNFIFLSDSAAINMRNIPIDNTYFALLIEFEYEDFGDLPANSENKPEYLIGKTTHVLENSLHQFVESTHWATTEVWSLRKKEILLLLYHLGHHDVLSMMGKPKISHKLHDLYQKQGFQQLTEQSICAQLAMSASTLRRKLNAEGTNLQQVKDRARLGLGLHLLQTTHYPIGLVAQKCGYQSQSRFTDRFKNHFGLTPSELKKTKLTDLGEKLTDQRLNRLNG